MIRAEISEIFSLNLIILMNCKLQVSEYSITQITGQELQMNTYLLNPTPRWCYSCFLVQHRRDVTSVETNGERKA